MNKTVKKRFNIKNEGKIRYFCNAILYIHWLSEVKQGRMIKTVVFFIFNNLVKLFGTKSFYNEMIARQKASEEEMECLFFGRKNGVHVIGSNRMLTLIYSGYACLISFPLMGIYMKYVDSNYSLITLIITLIPAFTVLFVEDRMTQKGKIYLKYFKHFDKENSEWRKKWTIIAFLFSIGSLLSFILSIRLCFVILGVFSLIPKW